MAMRLDQYLVNHFGFTRNKAQQLIDSGLVLLNAKICNKSSFKIKEDDTVSIVEDRRVNWVSRSAEKLAGFFEVIQGKIVLEWKNCLDIGSSTGWFTQVLLSLGVHHIDAVDVGTDQLHESIRQDSRVSSYEQTDIRNFAIDHPYIYDIIVCDASFISLSEIIDSISVLSDGYTEIVLLYKPQFEVGREHLRHTGVPKDPKIVEQKMKEFEWLLQLKYFNILKILPSSLKGEAGNQEWIYWIQKKSQN